MKTSRFKEVYGCLGADPQVKVVNGHKMAQFSIAETKTRVSKGGKRTVDIRWHSAVAWNEMADLVQKTLRKGSTVMIEGDAPVDGASERLTSDLIVTGIRFLQYQVA